MSGAAAITERLLAYGVIWVLFLAVRPARTVVVAQLSLLRRDLGGNGWRGVLCGAVLVVLDAVLMVAVGAFARASAGAWRPAASALALGLMYVVILAVTEEMIVRGVLLARLRQLFGDVSAVGVTAIVFAVMHVGRADLSALNLLQYALDGLLLGWLAVWTNAIWAGAGAHLAKNAGVMLLFGSSVHILDPMLVAVAGARPALTALADLLAYVAALACGLVLFRNARDRAACSRK